MKFLITAGPTREAIDPVRYLSNHSTGTMGYALARAARRHRHTVTLISGPTCLKPPKVNRFIAVETAREMHDAVIKFSKQFDVIIMCAAVADYRVKKIAKEKIKKNTDTLRLELVKNPDILMELSKRKTTAYLVGFALETAHAKKNAQKKLRTKNVDLLILNSMKDQGAGFGTDTNKVTLLYRDGRTKKYPKMKKPVLASVLIRDILYGK